MDMKTTAGQYKPSAALVLMRVCLRYENSFCYMLRIG